MLIERMIRAAKLDVNLYEEVEADTGATIQAFQAVIIVAVAAGIGAAIGARNGDVLGALVGGVLSAILGWLAWSFVTYFIGTNILGGTATWGELLRTLGFANSPSALLLFRFIPVLGGLISLVVAIWVLVAGVIAIRQALDVSTGKAIITVVIGWLVYLVISVVLGLLLFGFGLVGG